MKENNVFRMLRASPIALLAMLAGCADKKDSFESVAECGVFFISYSMFLGQTDEYANRQVDKIGEMIRGHEDYTPEKLTGLVDEFKFANAAYAYLYSENEVSGIPAIESTIPDEKTIAEAKEIKSTCDALVEENES